LEECLKPNFYQELEEKTARFVRIVQDYVDLKGYPFHMFHVGSIFWLSFSNKNRVQSSDEVNPKSSELFRVFFDELLNQGIYIGPSSYEVGFVSQAHSAEDLNIAAEAIKSALDTTYAG
jgi:glutamate-1-semialdehyde 2,1-aminomutase